jgi:hypothetical protein
MPSLADFAVGNAVPGGASPVDRVSPAMAARIEKMAADMPPELRARFKIISGYRDEARQAIVNPGVTNSRHTHHIAVDLNNDPAVISWISQNPQYGLGFPLAHMANEQNHMEMLDPGGKRIPIGYAATGDTGMKSGLARTPSDGTGNFGMANANLALSPDIQAQVTPPQAPTPGVDPELLAALASQGSPLGGSGLSDIITKATAATNPTLQPRPIITDPTQANLVGQPIPLSRRLI